MLISKRSTYTKSYFINFLTVSQIPQVTEEVEKALTVLGDVEALFSDVEISLLALEDTIDARELQEKQLEQRLKLDMHQERRKANFNEVSNQLEGEYQKKKVESDKRKVLASQERQKQGRAERDQRVLLRAVLVRGSDRCDDRLGR